MAKKDKRKEQKEKYARSKARRMADDDFTYAVRAQRAGNIKGALSYAKKAMREDPELPGPRIMIAEHLFERQKYGEALQYFLKLTDLCADAPQFPYFAAQCSRELGRYADAARLYLAAQEMAQISGAALPASNRELMRFIDECQELADKEEAARSEQQREAELRRAAERGQRSEDGESVAAPAIELPREEIEVSLDFDDGAALAALESGEYDPLPLYECRLMSYRLSGAGGEAQQDY